MKRVHIYVYGNVQGVFFRDFALESARKLNIKGWVRNLEDGSVEVTAEADKEVLEKFVNELWAGPKASNVEDMRIEWKEPTREFKSFEKKETI